MPRIIFALAVILLSLLLIFITDWLVVGLEVQEVGSVAIAGGTGDQAKAATLESQAEVAIGVRDAARSEPFEERPTFSDTETISIRVVDLETGQAIADAQVWGAPNLNPTLLRLGETKRQVPAQYPDFEALLKELGEEFVTDRNGIVEVAIAKDLFDSPSPFSPLLTRTKHTWIARVGDRFGIATSDTVDRGILTIELSRDLTAEVLILGAAGQPAAGIAIAVVVDPASVELTRKRTRVYRTDGRGRAVIRHLQTQVVHDTYTATVSTSFQGLRSLRSLSTC